MAWSSLVKPRSALDCPAWAPTDELCELGEEDQIFSLLGDGQRGVVKLAWWRPQDEGGRMGVVAVKVVRADRLTPVHVPPHPVLVHVHTRYASHTGAGEACWLEVRECCTGGTLFDALPLFDGPIKVPSPPLGEPKRLIPDEPLERHIVQGMRWFRELLSAVAHCHSHNLCCGQIRIEHLLLTGDGALKLLGDWRPATEDAEPVRLRLPSPSSTQRSASGRHMGVGA